MANPDHDDRPPAKRRRRHISREWALDPTTYTVPLSAAYVRSPAHRPRTMEDGDCCCICLLLVDRVARGRIDGCDHIFCFVCIMEWAKIETRCPICYSRFQSVKRSIVPGVFECEHLVAIDAIDKATSFHSERKTKCSLCENSKDEDLLVFCNLCNMAGHAHCIGSGIALPFDDWYCDDCSMSMKHYLGSQLMENPSIQKFGTTAEVWKSERPVSVYEIVAGENSSDSPGGSPSSETICGQDGGEAVSSALEDIDRSRSLHDLSIMRIQALRDNWKGLRSGAIGFSSCSVGKYKGAGASTNSSGSSGHQSSSYSGTSTVAVRSRMPEDVTKAWKKMEIAKYGKSKYCTGSLSSSVTNKKIVPKVFPVIMSCCGSAGQTGATHNVADELGGSSFKATGNTLKPNKISQCTLPEVAGIKRATSLKPHMFSSEGTSLSGNLRTKASHGSNIKFSRQKHWSNKASGCSGFKTALKPIPLAVRPDSSSLPCTSGLLVDSVDSNDMEKFPEKGNRALGTDAELLEIYGSNNCFNNNQYRNCVRLDTHVNKNPQVGNRMDVAKTQILPLVKHFLQSINGHKILGVNKFKEVARAATHTALAACGLEHSKSVVAPSLLPFCEHRRDMSGHQYSSLMPHICRSCFETFVKSIVETLFAKKRFS